MTSSLSSAPLDDRYVVGLDLGQSVDPSAIAVVRRVEPPEERDRPIFQCGYLERLPLNTPYPSIVRHVRTLLSKPPLLGCAELVIDMTGVGRPCFDLFESVGVDVTGVTITGGDGQTWEGGSYRVSKLILVSRLQALLHDGRLKIQKTLPEAPALVQELQDFRAEVSDLGNWRFGARSGKHDDLVLALAIAVWRAYGGQPGQGYLDYYRHLETA